MRTERSAASGAIQAVSGRAVAVVFDGGPMTSDAGALPLGQADAAVGLVDRLAACFADHRDGRFVEHSVRTLVGRRVFGIALGYEDSIDHDVLRGGPVMAVLAGKLRAKRRTCAPVVGKSTPSRLELGGSSPSGDGKIVHDGSAIADVLAEASGQRAERRVVGKAEWSHGKANPRFVIASLAASAHGARSLYEDLYCQRGEMENRIEGANSTGSPTARRRTACAPTSSACGSPR